MSRKGGASYDYDDDYAYEDDDYEEEASQYVVRRPAAKPAGKAAKAPPAKPGGKKGASPAPVADDELLAGTLPRLREVMADSGFTDADLTRALREGNYDLDAAVISLFGGADPKPQSPVSTKPAPKSTTPAAAAPAGGVRPSPKPATAAAAKPSTVAAASPVQARPSAPVHADPVASPSRTPAVASPAPADMKASAAASPIASPPPQVLQTVVDAAGKKAMSLVLAGHVDHGKSTILGHILLLLGQVSARDLQKLEQQAKQAGKASFHFAWVLDQSDEERRRGVTIDSALHSFETASRCVAVLDAPGHRDFIPNMVTSATQADAALVVVSALPGELKAGLEQSTREHLFILKMLGVSQLVIAINKMDAVDFDQAIFESAKTQVVALAAEVGFMGPAVAAVVPVSGLQGVNLAPGATAAPLPASLSAWYSGPTLVEAIDQCPVVDRLVQFPARFVVHDLTKQVMTGRVEAGVVRPGDTLICVPGSGKILVRGIEKHQNGSTTRVTQATAGETVEIATSSDVSVVGVGCVLCPPKQPCQMGTDFEAFVQFLPELERAVLPGTQFQFQAHSVTLQVTVERLLGKHLGDGKYSTVARSLGPGANGIVHLKTPHPIALEEADRCVLLSRFVLRQNGSTVGGGVVKKVL